MKFVSTHELCTRPGEVWKRLEDSGELVISYRGRPVALLSGITEKTLEPTLTALRRARAQIGVSQLRASAQVSGSDKMTASEIDAEIRSSRQGKTG